MTIHPDWSVETPHDLLAEQVAAAFGGYNSCVDLTDVTIPAFRAALGVLTRRERLDLRRSQRGWHIGPRSHQTSCCRGTVFTDVGMAARHLRSVDHLARAHEVPHWQLASVMTGAAATWGPWESSPDVSRDVAGLLRGPSDVIELWRAGIHPDSIQTMAAAAATVDELLPASFFVGMAYGSVDRSWLAAVLAHRPDPDVASWLTWLDAPQDLAPAAVWGGWLAFGLPKRSVLTAVRAGIGPEYVHEVAVVTGWSTTRAAHALAGWALAGCVPSIDDFTALEHHGLVDHQPSPKAIDGLCADAELGVGLRRRTL